MTKHIRILLVTAVGLTLGAVATSGAYRRSGSEVSDRCKDRLHGRHQCQLRR